MAMMAAAKGRPDPKTAFATGLLLVALILLWGSLPVYAAGESDVFEKDIFGSGDPFGDEDDLFGGGLLVDVEQSSEKSLADELLSGQTLRVGGRYDLSYDAAWNWRGFDAKGGPFGANVDSSLRLGGNVFTDFRPNRDVRLFGKVRIDGSGRTGDLTRFQGKAKLTELFGDFHYDDRVFFRIGKQTIHWGVGYFFSPADVINIGRIDPQDPEADREGPVALRVNVPVRSDNYYMYAVADEVDDGLRVAIAPKAEWVLGRTEYGLGGYYRADRVPRLMATVSSSIGSSTAVFGEGVVNFGSDRRFVVEDASAPFGVRADSKQGQLVLQGTVGLRRTWSDRDGRFHVTVAAQYLFDGDSYRRGEWRRLAETYPLGIGALLSAGELTEDDLSDGIRHQGALAISWSEAFGSRLSPSLFWLGDLHHDAGMVVLSVGVRTWDKVQLSVGVNHAYGTESVMNLLGVNPTQLFFTVGYGNSF